MEELNRMMNTLDNIHIKPIDAGLEAILEDDECTLYVDDELEEPPMTICIEDINI